MLISAVVDVCVRWRPTAPALAASKNVGAAGPATPFRERTYEPVFLQGMLCERVVDVANGHEFYISTTGEIESDEYDCRMAAKDGRWIWYCTKAC